MAKTCDFKRTKDSVKAWYKTNKIIDDFNNILNLGKFRTKVTEHSNEIVREFGLPLERIYKEENNGTKAVMNYSYLAKVDNIKKKRKAELNKALLKAQSEQAKNIPDITISKAEIAKDDNDLFYNLRYDYFNGKYEQNSVDFLKKISSSNFSLNTLANYLIPFSEQNNVKIKLVKEISVKTEVKNPLGVYIPATNTIEINMFANSSDKKIETVILHEIIHSITYRTIQGNSSNVKKLNKYLEEARKYLPAYNVEDNTGTYALYDIDEFIVGLFTNAKFINQLSNIPSIENNSNLLDDIFDFILGLLKINKKDTLYKDAYFAATNILNDFLMSSIAAKDYLNEDYYQNDERKELGIYESRLSLSDYLKNQDTSNIKKGVSELFEENPEFSSQIYEALGFNINLPIVANKEIEFLLHKEKLKINLQDITLEEEGEIDLNLKNKWNTFAIKAQGKKLGYIQVLAKDDNTVKIGLSALFEGKEDVKQSIISKILDLINNLFKTKKVEDSGKKININAGKGIGKIAYELLAVKLKQDYQKDLISDTTRSDYAENLWKFFEKQGKASVIGKTDTQYRWDYYYKFNVDTQITLEQKQQAQQLYTHYLDTIFPDSKVEEIDNSLYISVLNQLEQENKIEKDCSGGGKLKAKDGIATLFEKGGKWAIVTDFKNAPTHKLGGKDISIQSKKVEVEKNELKIENDFGDVAVIPSKYRTEVQNAIKSNCHSCIDGIVESLPKMKDYAGDGTVFPFFGRYKRFKNSLPDNLKNTPEDDYAMRYYWKHGNKPKSFDEAINREQPMFTMEDDGYYHAPSVEPNTLRFLKPKNHPTLQYELDWYNSDNPDAVDFRSRYDLDTSGKFYRYVPKKK